MQRLVMAAAIAAASLSGIPATADGVTQTRAYVGGPGPYTYVAACQGDFGAPYGVSVACFEGNSATSASISIVDDSGLPVAANYWIIGGPDGLVYGRRFCGRGQASLVPGWTRLYVWLAGPVEAVTWCLGYLDEGFPATRGVVHATFN